MAISIFAATLVILKGSKADTDNPVTPTLDVWDGKTVQFIKFWEVFFGSKDQKNEKVYVIISAKGFGQEFQEGKPVKGSSGHTVKVSFNEVKGFLKLQKELYPISDNLKFIYGGNRYKDEIGNTITMTTPHYKEDQKLIIIGSTHANEVCNKFMTHSKLDLPYEYTTIKDVSGKEHKSIRIKKTNEYYPSISNLEDFEKDYGIILRVKNPCTGSNKKILVLGGNHGPGTQSAISFVTYPTSETDMQIIVNKAGDADFMAIFEANTSHSKRQGFDLKILKLSKLEGENWNEQNI